MSASQSTPPPNTRALYAAACNPPRKAKRPRHESVSLETYRPSSQSTPMGTHNVRIRPAPTQPATEAIPLSQLPATSAEKPGEPGPSAPMNSSFPETTASSSTQIQLPLAKKRGRKPHNSVVGTSRSARESQRKINHSRIEKARRNKINDAFDALRVLVPSNFRSEVRKYTVFVPCCASA